MPNSSGAVDLNSLSAEEREAVEKIAAEQGQGSYPGDQNPDDNKKKVLTAFLVLVNYDGTIELSDVENESLLVQSQPTSDLIYSACATAMKDISNHETASRSAHMTAQIMQQQARALMEQQQASAIAANLQKGGGLRG